MNYYKRFIGDYQSDTAHLSIIEHGAYTLLLDYVYGTGRNLPKQKSSIYRICRAFESVEQDAIDSVLAQYFIEQDDGWANEKALRVMATDLPRIEAAKRNGKRGGRPKGKTQKKPSGLSKQNPVANPEETQSESYPQPQPQPQPQPITREEKKKKEKTCLPPYVSAQTWRDIKAHRTRIKKPMTERAEAILLNKLESIHSAGISVDDAVDLMVEKGWASISVEWYENAINKASVGKGKSGAEQWLAEQGGDNAAV